MDIEHKLDLIQQIHREQAESERNFYRKYNYREPVYCNDEMYGKNQAEENEAVSWIVSFRLRLLLAITLFLCFFIMEKKEIGFEGVGCLEIVEGISSNIDIENLFFEQ